MICAWCHEPITKRQRHRKYEALYDDAFFHNRSPVDCWHQFINAGMRLHRIRRSYRTPRETRKNGHND